MKKRTIYAFAISTLIIFIGLSLLHAHDAVITLLNPADKWYSPATLIFNIVVAGLLSLFVAGMFTTDEEIYGNLTKEDLTKHSM